jgi:pilus assembly protein CpaB
MASSNSLARLKSPWVLLIFAVALAAIVAYIAYAYLQQREERIKQDLAASNNKRQTPKVSVVVPREDVRIGVVVEQGMFVAREIDQDLVYPDTVLASDFSTVRGQRLARPVLHGRPLRLTDLTVPEVRDVASVLPVGMRAVTIEIDNVNSISQTLRPGHRVDVFLISTATKSKGADSAESSEGPLNQAMLYMQNLAVIATGQEFQDVASPDSDRISKMARPGEIEGQRDKGFDTITVLVSPAEAARLLVGQKLGSYRVALRGTKDDRAVALRPLTGNDVLPHPEAGGPGGGVEFIVGGKSGGAAALPPTLVSMGQPNAARGAPAAPAQKTPDVKATVQEVLRNLTAPRTSINADDRDAKSAPSPATR